MTAEYILYIAHLHGYNLLHLSRMDYMELSDILDTWEYTLKARGLLR